MTLKDFFLFCGENPVWIIAFFVLVPFTALLAGIMGRGEGHLSPWKYLYSTLLYLVCVPGIFAITLNIYLFMFERNRSILDMDIFTQVLPVVSMIATILLIRKNVSLDYVPGFDKLGGLFMMIFATLIILWVFDRTRIWVVTMMPFWVAILIFAGLLLAVRIGWGRLVGGGAPPASPPSDAGDWYEKPKK